MKELMFGSGSVPPAPEVVAKPARRAFSASHKARIVAEADACSNSAEMGLLLRPDALDSSRLAAWRKAQREGAFGALAGRKRGQKPRPDKAHEKALRHLEREGARASVKPQPFAV